MHIYKQVSFSLVCHTITIWLSNALAIFRCIVLYFPRFAKSYCGLNHVKLVIMFIYISTALLFIPNYVINKLVQKDDLLDSDLVAGSNKTNGSQSVYYAVESVAAEDEASELSQVNFWLNALLVKLIPCTLLTLLTIVLVLTMKRAQQRHLRLIKHTAGESCDRSQETNRTTRMLTAVVVLFLVSELPQGLLTSILLVDSSLFVKLYMPLGDLLDMLALISSAATFVLYCTMSKQFRDCFVDVFKLPSCYFTPAPSGRKHSSWIPLFKKTNDEAASG